MCLFTAVLGLLAVRAVSSRGERQGLLSRPLAGFSAAASLGAERKLQSWAGSVALGPRL